eukprot:3939904-Rhodomonas_salina.1
MHVALDDDAGQCLDFESDPFVVAIMPDPTDYFRVCGTTSMCRRRCGAVMEAFESANVGGLTRGFEEFEQEVESMFFVDDDEDSKAPFQLVLSSMLIQCAGAGAGETCSGRCVAVFGVQWDGTAAVRRYCVPYAPGRGVRSLSSWGIPGSPASWSMGRLADSAGSSVVVVTTNTSKLLMFAKDGEQGGALRRWSLHDQLPGVEQ